MKMHNSNRFLNIFFSAVPLAPSPSKQGGGGGLNKVHWYSIIVVVQSSSVWLLPSFSSLQPFEYSVVLHIQYFSRLLVASAVFFSLLV